MGLFRLPTQLFGTGMAFPLSLLLDRDLGNSRLAEDSALGITLASAGYPPLFISEARVVQSVLHQRAARLGAARVRQELLHKGIAPEVVAEAVAGLQGSELERAREVWKRRFGSLPQDAAERAKQVRFLMARGFAGAVVAKLLRGELDE